MDLGQKLFELRKSKNLSQEEVADKLNVTRQTVSKWETNQSTPDFDKIVPLCELFEISTDELLIGKKPEENKEEESGDNVKLPEVENKAEDAPKTMTKDEVRRKSAEVVSSSVFIYIVAIALLTIAIPVLNINPIVVSALFLIAVAWATARMIKHFMSVPKFEKTEKEKKEDVILKQINGIVGAICTILYFVISFATMAWYITWVIFIIDGLICQIIKLMFMLKEDDANEK